MEDSDEGSSIQQEGNQSLEAATNWIVEHENDPGIDQMSLFSEVPVSSKNPEAPKSVPITEEIKQKQQELSELDYKRNNEEGQLKEGEKEKAERCRKLGLPPEEPVAVKSSVPPVGEERDDEAKAKTNFNTLMTFANNAATNPSSEKSGKFRLADSNLQPSKVIEWEDYEQELARMCSLSSALEEAKSKKLLFDQNLQSLIQIESESLSQSNKLDQMREKLEHRKLLMGKMSMHSKLVKEKEKKQEEQLSGEIRSLSVGGSSLSVAIKRLQDASRLLAGEKGNGHLKSLQKLLRLRQQHMVSQINLLFPVKPLDQSTFSISGLHLTVPSLTNMSFFTDKKEAQRSSTALGYVAHVVSLIASYLQVPLRYPLRLGGSRSYICDNSPSVEHSATTSKSVISTSSKPVEFPLFVEGQDSTRAAYAVFLLNKDLEQLLNFIGINSLGPRHILANLNELVRTILSPEYIDM